MSWPQGNPGSDKARAAGCKCPVLDNCYGREAPWPPNGWWMVDGCPVHTPTPSKDIARCPTCDVPCVPQQAKLVCPKCHQLAENCCGD